MIARVVPAALACCAVSPAAAPAATAQLVGTPSVRYVTVSDHGSRLISIGAVFRTDRALDRSAYGTIIAPSLAAGDHVPSNLFGGGTPGAIGRPSGHCYVAELSQLRR